MNELSIWVPLFVLCALVIARAGWILIAAVDVVAERTGLARAFLGMILVATITSLPELATGVSAVTLAGSPDIAVGDVVGACVFNLLLFAVADVTSPRVAFYGGLSPTHNLTAAFSTMLLGLLVLAILTPDTARVSIGHVGIYSVILALLYLGATRLLYAVNIPPKTGSEEKTSGPTMSLRAATLRCTAAAGAVTGAGILLAISGSRIAEAANLTDSLVGALFVAAATTMPELATTLAAVRARSYDLAAGNLLGSNLFNMLILVVDDLAYLDGPLLAAADEALAIPAVVAIVMTTVVIAALNYVKRTTPRIVDLWAGLSLAGLYLLNAWLLATSGS
jgi:cation:H+ antiporter